MVTLVALNNPPFLLGIKGNFLLNLINWIHGNKLVTFNEQGERVTVLLAAVQ